MAAALADGAPKSLHPKAGPRARNALRRMIAESDPAGYAAAVGWSGRYSVTVAVGGIRFVAPIRISDLVTVTTKLVYTGTSSMHFAVDVRARDPMGDPAADRLCTHCVIVFVAMDEAAGKSIPVPSWTPRTEDDRELADYALKVMELSKGIEQTVARFQA